MPATTSDCWPRPTAAGKPAAASAAVSPSTTATISPPSAPLTIRGRLRARSAAPCPEENGKASKLSSSAQSYFKGANKSTGKQPDTSWPGTNIWTDLTTAKEWNKHVKKYGSNFGEGIPILYERGKGIINSHKLKSGVGVTAQGVREIHNKAKELYDQTRKDR